MRISVLRHGTDRGRVAEEPRGLPTHPSNLPPNVQELASFLSFDRTTLPYVPIPLPRPLHVYIPRDTRGPLRDACRLFQFLLRKLSFKISLNYAISYDISFFLFDLSLMARRFSSDFLFSFLFFDSF